MGSRRQRLGSGRCRPARCTGEREGRPNTKVHDGLQDATRREGSSRQQLESRRCRSARCTGERENRPHAYTHDGYRPDDYCSPVTGMKTTGMMTTAMMKTGMVTAGHPPVVIIHAGRGLLHLLSQPLQVCAPPEGATGGIGASHVGGAAHKQHRLRLHSCSTACVKILNGSHRTHLCSQPPTLPAAACSPLPPPPHSGRTWGLALTRG